MMIRFIEKIIDYIKYGLWEKRDFKDRKSHWLTRQMRVIAYTAKGVNKHESIIRSAALTFYTLMSLVPIAALAFGAIKAFGLDDRLGTYLIETFPRYTELIRAVIDFADNVIQRTRGGVVAISGLVILVWAAVRVFVNVESAFNSIWEVKKQRSIARKASAYAIMIFVVPILWISIHEVFSYVKNFIGHSEYLVGKIIYILGTALIAWMVFTFIYKVIPNTKVLFRNAAKAGAIAAVSFMIFQWIYVYIQRGVSSYNLIYGSFASIPLFLLWVQTSWQILLFGGELSFSFQNIESYIQEYGVRSVSPDDRKKIILAVMLVVIRSFARGEGGITSEKLSRELKLPVRLIRDSVYQLENAGLVIEAESHKSDKVNLYFPARDIHSITLCGVLGAVEDIGSGMRGLSESMELRHVAEIVDNMKKMIADSDLNVPLIELTELESTEKTPNRRITYKKR